MACRSELTTLVRLSRELDEAATEQAIRYLVETHGSDAIAVCLLWSFNEPKHERRIKELINRISPDTYVSISSDIAPIPGEYERTSTTVINGLCWAGWFATMSPTCRSY